MAQEKTPNYTDAQIERMKEVYDPTADQETRSAQVKELADELGKKPSQIIGKLVHLGVYVAKTYQKKGTGETKEQAIGRMADSLEVPQELFDSFEKANKTALIRAANEIQTLVHIVEGLTAAAKKEIVNE